jgi:hypothetical protein
MNVRFIDTSIMTNLLGVPAKSERAEAVKLEFRDAVESKETLILPISTIIETGNHIAHISDGRLRREIAIRFSECLQKTASGEASWTLYGNELSIEDLQYLAAEFPRRAVEEMSIGDLSVIRAYHTYKEKISGIGKIMIWSMDAHLQAYQEDLTGTVRRCSR